MVAKRLDDTLITALNRYTILRRELEYYSRCHARHKILWEDMFSVEKEIQWRIKRGEKISKHLFNIDYLRDIQSYILRYSFFHFPTSKTRMNNGFQDKYSTFDIIPLVKDFMQAISTTEGQLILSTRQERFLQHGLNQGIVTILEDSSSPFFPEMHIKVDGLRTFSARKKEWFYDGNKTDSFGLLYVEPLIFTTQYHKNKFNGVYTSSCNTNGEFFVGDDRFIEKLFLKDAPKWDHCLYVGNHFARPRLNWKPSNELEQPPYIGQVLEYN